ISGFALAQPAPGTQVCNGRPDGPDCNAATSVTLRADAVMQSGVQTNPFARVHFYRVDATGDTHLIGTATAASANDAGGVRTWRWTLTFTPTGLPAQSAHADLRHRRRSAGRRAR